MGGGGGGGGGGLFPTVCAYTVRKVWPSEREVMVLTPPGDGIALLADGILSEPAISPSSWE